MSRLGAAQTLKIYLIVLIWSAFVFWAGFSFGTREREVPGSVEADSRDPVRSSEHIPWTESGKDIGPSFSYDSKPAEPLSDADDLPAGMEAEKRQPAEAVPEVVLASPVLPPDFYTVQVAAFRSEGECRSLLKRLKGSGHEPRLVQPNGPGGLFRVWVGQFETKDEAKALEETLKDGGFSTYVRTCPPPSNE